MPEGLSIHVGLNAADPAHYGDRNGLFTQTLRQTWRDGAFQGNYRSFWKTIVKAMPLWQAPNFFWAGEPSIRFERQRPFSI
jgi:metacaspase-1